MKRTRKHRKKCPNCGSDNTGEIMKGTSHTRIFACLDCNERWGYGQMNY